MSSKAVNGVLNAETKLVSSSSWVTSAISTSTDYHGFLWANKTVTYKWTESQGRSNTTNYYVPADKNIRTSFITGDENINITSGGNLYINGNIQNAGAGRSFGAVNLTSANGNDKRIITDEVSLNAAKGIDITHNGISELSKLNAATTSGNIKIESTGSLLLGAVTVQNGRLDLSAYKTLPAMRRLKFRL